MIKAIDPSALFNRTTSIIIICFDLGALIDKTDHFGAKVGHVLLRPPSLHLKALDTGALSHKNSNQASVLGIKQESGKL